MKGLFVLIFLYTILATSHASETPIHLLRHKYGSGGHHVKGLSCLTWRLAVETNNIRNWTTVPLSCEEYVGNYMLGGQYRKDSKLVAHEAIAYAKGLKLGGDGKDIWVFDIDETTLSNLPYYAQHGFGAVPYNSPQFNAWVDQGKAPPLPENLKLYKKVLALGMKVVFITGRSEERREITSSNLKKVGYHTWEKLILKEEGDSNPAIIYKSRERKKLEEKDGYRIVGNMGDQWSDILGTNIGKRTFKVPDPLYYIS